MRDSPACGSLPLGLLPAAILSAETGCPSAAAASGAAAALELDVAAGGSDRCFGDTGAYAGSASMAFGLLAVVTDCAKLCALIAADSAGARDSPCPTLVTGLTEGVGTEHSPVIPLHCGSNKLHSTLLKCRLNMLQM